MTTGSCLCGEIKVAYTGDPRFTAKCYCNDCAKLPSVRVFQIPEAQFSMTQGQPKEWTKVSDFGNEIINHFCGTCGTVLYRTGGAIANKDNIGLRAGVLDDQSILDKAPAIEVYVDKRPPWVKPVEGTVQLNSKYNDVTKQDG